MLEAELAGVMAFVKEHTDGIQPYYKRIKENFAVPSVYYPRPRIFSGQFSLSSYSQTFMWYIRFFGKDSEAAWGAGYPVLDALQRGKWKIPLIDGEGAPTGRTFYVGMTEGGFIEPELREIDDGIAQLTLVWDSPRAFPSEAGETIEHVHVGWELKSAFDSAVRRIDGNEGKSG